MSLLDRFATEYQTYHGLSASRCRSQLKELRAFAAFAGKTSPEECDGADLRSYLGHLLSQGLHVNTVRKRSGYIRPFFSWAYEVGIIDGEKLMAIRAVRNPKGATNQSLPKPYTTKELRQFWTELDARFPKVSNDWWRRFRSGRSKFKRVATHAMRLQIEAMIALALDCGLRQGEILALDIDDFHYDNAYVVVRQRSERGNGKDRRREVPHTKDSRKAVQHWLELRHSLNPDHDRPWLSLAGEHGEPQGVYARPLSLKRMKTLLLKIGDWQLHRFRHTCATNWLRAGMPLEVVSRLLGHKKTSQTLMYAEIVRDDIERSVQVNEGRFRQMTGRRAA